MHNSGEMMWSALRSPLIASVGQRLTQAVQPMQVSMIRYAICASCVTRPYPTRQGRCGDRSQSGDPPGQVVQHDVYEDARDGHIGPDRERPNRDALVPIVRALDGGKPHG